MNKKEFIQAIRSMADEIEQGHFKFIDLANGSYVFGNRNYGEVNIKVADGVGISVRLFTADEEKKNEGC